MKPYPDFHDVERHTGITWSDLITLEPRLEELLWTARQTAVTGRRWSHVDRAFALTLNGLTDLVGFSSRNHRHPLLGGCGAYQVAYWRLYDAVAGLLPGRAPGVEEAAEKQPPETVAETSPAELSFAATAGAQRLQPSLGS